MNVSLQKLTDILNRLQAQINALSGGGSGGAVDSVNGQTGNVVLTAADLGAVESIVAGANVTVDNTDPQHPVVSATGGGSTPTSTRWWRVYMTANNGGTANVGIVELQFRATPGGANLCTGGTPFASGTTDSSHLPSNAFNGSLTDNGWFAGAATPQFIGYQLPAASQVNEVMVGGVIGSTTNRAFNPQNMIVQSSTNSTTGADGTWKDEWYIQGQTLWNASEARVFPRPP